jgi:hypothetical protein
MGGIAKYITICAIPDGWRIVSALSHVRSHSTVDVSVCPQKTYTSVEPGIVKRPCVAHCVIPFPLPRAPYLITALTKYHYSITSVKHHVKYHYTAREQ